MDFDRLFAAFHSGSVDLGSINRAHVVLLPKTSVGIPIPGGFHPVSLQNFPMKMICFHNPQQISTNESKSLLFCTGQSLLLIILPPFTNI